MSTAATSRGLAYTTKSEMVGGAWKTFAHAACCKCDKALKIGLDGTNNPEAVQGKARKQGWSFDAWHVKSIVCPECIAEHDRRRHGESGRKVVNLVPATPATAEARPLTVEERTRVRNHLGGTFDEENGCYLDGWSDQRVGEALDLPAACGRAYREAAFGPLRAVPELAPLQARADTLAEELKVLAERQGGAQQDLEALKRELRDVAEKLGVRS